MKEFIESFKKEALGLLENLERSLLKLEKVPGNKELISEIFRILHTLKGTGAMFDFKEVTEITHLLENIYADIRDDLKTVDENILALSFRTVDILRSIIEENINENDYKELLNDIGEYSPEIKAACEKQKEKTSTYFIIYKPDKNIFTRGLNPLSVLNELNELGEISSIIHNDKIPVEQQIEQKKFLSWWEIYLYSTKDMIEIEEVFMFNFDKEYKIIPIMSENDVASEILPLLSENYKKDEKVDADKIKDTINRYLKKSGSVPQSQSEKKQDTPTQKTNSKTAQVDTSINVSSEKLDVMMNLVSELVTANAELKLNADKVGSDNLDIVVEKIDKLSKKFKDNILDIRLVPIATLETMLQRLVYDLSKSLKKEVRLITEGMDTELDKTIIHALESPLMHIIRNSIDHGIEPADERLNKNKPGEGLVKFTSFYSGSNVLIQIQDDGGGINLEKVRKAAIVKGYITQDQAVSDKELLEFTMNPGFTTSENVSIVSGRGVGLDVVKSEISLIRGQLEINTEKDLGTIITIKLPLTLSILDCLLVAVSQFYFLIPATEIEYCYQEKSDVLFSKYQKKLEYLDELIPLINLRTFFSLGHNEPEILKIIIIHKENERIALIADQIIGKHQAVLKPLGKIFKDQEYLSGASILGDGNLALIIDTNKLIYELKKEKQLNII